MFKDYLEYKKFISSSFGKIIDSQKPTVIAEDTKREPIYTENFSFPNNDSNETMEIFSVQDLGKDALKNSKEYDAFMGISIQHKYFGKNTMRYFIYWAAKKFKTFSILLMDDPHSYNEMVFKKRNQEDALKKSRDIGQEKRQSYEHIIRSFGLDNVKIYSFREFSSTTEFKNIKNDIIKFADTNSAFREDLMQLVAYGTQSKFSELIHNDNLSEEEIINKFGILSEYIVDEIAALIYFTEVLNKRIEIDPTIEFTTKTRLYNNDFQNSKEFINIKRRGHIFVCPKDIYKTSF